MKSVYNAPMEWARIEDYTGQIAAVGTSVLWTFTTLFFTAAGKRVGATVVNATRICFACLLLAVTHRYLQGYWVPDIPSQQLLYLAVSGLVGLTIGDQAIIAAFVEIGPRLTLLLTTTAPLWAALFGFVVLGEELPGTAWLGMALTIGGILWVIGERSGATPLPQRRLARGLFLALVAALCQSGGYLLSKMGMGHGEGGIHVEAQTASFLRMFFAAMTILPVLGVQLWRKRPRDSTGDGAGGPARAAGDFVVAGRGDARPRWRAGILLSLCGAVTGPYLGVWLSLVACDRAPLGVAQTLLTLSPIFILPATAILHKERITLRAATGALLAVAGAALLFGAR